MITLLYVTYFIFAGIAAISTAILLFKLNVALATLIVGFSVLSYVVRVWGNMEIIKKREQIYASYQKELEAELVKKQQEENSINIPLNTAGMN
jgi:hypothetical protein